MEAVELLVLIDDRLAQSVGVHGFTSQGEHRLRTHIAALGYTTGGRQTLGDKDTRLIAQIVLCILGGAYGFGVVEVHLAVAEFGVIEQVLFRSFACGFSYAGNGFALAFRVLNLLEHDFRHLRVLVQVVVELQANKVVDELVDGDAACRAHIFRAEFDFRLALEHGFFDIDGNSAYYAVADVGEFLILAVELLDRSADSLAEGSLVCTALYGVLTVDERVILLTCLVGVCEGDLYIFAYDVNDRIEWIDCHCFGQQVEQTVLGEELSPVVVQGQACV